MGANDISPIPLNIIGPYGPDEKEELKQSDEPVLVVSEETAPTMTNAISVRYSWATGVVEVRMAFSTYSNGRFAYKCSSPPFINQHSRVAIQLRLVVANVERTRSPPFLKVGMELPMGTKGLSERKLGL